MSQELIKQMHAEDGCDGETLAECIQQLRDQRDGNRYASDRALAEGVDALQAHVAALRAALALVEPIKKVSGYFERPHTPSSPRGQEYAALHALVEAAESALAATPEQCLAALTAPLESKIYALREAVQFVLDCGSEGVDWSGETTKQSALGVCRRAIEATPDQCAARLAAIEEAACLRMAREFCEGKRNGRGANSLLSGYVNAMRAEVAAKAAAEALERAAEFARTKRDGHHLGGDTSGSAAFGAMYAHLLIEAQRLREST